MTDTTKAEDGVFRLNPGQVKLQAGIASSARYILARSGSGSGKSFEIVRELIWRAVNAPGSTQAIFRHTATAARGTIWRQIIPDVMAKCFPGLAKTCDFNQTTMTLTFENGASIIVLGLDDNDKILGLSIAGAFVDEVSEVPYEAVSKLVSRVRQKIIVPRTGRNLSAKLIYACNPTSTKHWTHDIFIKKVKAGTSYPLAKPDNYVDVFLSPYDNAENLGADYIESLEDMPPAERRRFLDGEWSADVVGALWKQDQIDKLRIREAPEMVRVVVAVDPNIKGKDEVGIVIAGLCSSGFAYVLGDYSIRTPSPIAWAKEVARAYEDFNASKVIAENNQGGNMVETVVRGEAPNINYAPLWSSKGKIARAEPVAALYEQGKVFHVGEHKQLETQMCSLTTDFDARRAGWSPDRADALVFALTELMLKKQGGGMVVGRFTGL